MPVAILLLELLGEGYAFVRTSLSAYRIYRTVHSALAHMDDAAVDHIRKHTVVIGEEYFLYLAGQITLKAIYSTDVRTAEYSDANYFDAVNTLALTNYMKNRRNVETESSISAYADALGDALHLMDPGATRLLDRFLSRINELGVLVEDPIIQEGEHLDVLSPNLRVAELLGLSFDDWQAITSSEFRRTFGQQYENLLTRYKTGRVPFHKSATLPGRIYSRLIALEGAVVNPEPITTGQHSFSLNTDLLPLQPAIFEDKRPALVVPMAVRPYASTVSDNLMRRAHFVPVREDAGQIWLPADQTVVKQDPKDPSKFTYARKLETTYQIHDGGGEQKGDADYVEQIKDKVTEFAKEKLTHWAKTKAKEYIEDLIETYL